MAVLGEHRASPALSLEAAAATASVVDVGFLCDGAAVVGGSSLYSRHSAHQCQHVNAETDSTRTAQLCCTCTDVPPSQSQAKLQTGGGDLR
jgi:hypothetical protein